MTALTTETRAAWIEQADCDLDDFRALVSTETDSRDYPLASDVRQGVLVYSAETMANADRHALQTELIRALADGPGVVVFEGAFEPTVVDRASVAFTAIIEAQRGVGGAAG
jgi:hypothetical protein